MLSGIIFITVTFQLLVIETFQLLVIEMNIAIFAILHLDICTKTYLRVKWVHRFVSLETVYPCIVRSSVSKQSSRIPNCMRS